MDKKVIYTPCYIKPFPENDKSKNAGSGESAKMV